jgi:hypothetical protein
VVRLKVGRRLRVDEAALPVTLAAGEWFFFGLAGGIVAAALAGATADRLDAQAHARRMIHTLDPLIQGWDRAGRVLQHSAGPLFLPRQTGLSRSVVKKVYAHLSLRLLARAAE